MIYAIVTALGSLVLAALVHIATVLLVPQLAHDTIWDELDTVLTSTQAQVLARPGPDSRALGTLDPSVVITACRFDLDDGPLAVRAPTTAPQWMLSVHDRNGNLLYGLSSEAELAGGINLELRTRAQERGLVVSAVPDDRLRITAEADAGFVLFRMLVAHPSESEQITRLAERVRCNTLPDRT